jgi:hypothetical protein
MSILHVIVTKYSWNGQILYEIKSKSELKFEHKKLRHQHNQFFLVQILRDLSNLKDQIKHDQI